MSLRPILNVSFGRGVACGMLATLAANGLYWFINTPSFSDASVLRVAGVAGQVVVCALAALWLYARERRAAGAALPTPAQAR